MYTNNLCPVWIHRIQRKHLYSIHSQVASCWMKTYGKHSQVTVTVPLSEAMPTLQQFQKLMVGDAGIWSLSSGHNFPHGYSEGPLHTIKKKWKIQQTLQMKPTKKLILAVIFWTDHITLAGVDRFRKALYSHPLDWHSNSNLLSVIVTAVDLLGQAEVSYPNTQIISQPSYVDDEQDKKKIIQIPLVYCEIQCSEMPSWSYMQLRAAKSLCKKPLELRYSMPEAMSIMKRSRVW